MGAEIDLKRIIRFHAVDSPFREIGVGEWRISKI
jgi:hypothetical protein